MEHKITIQQCLDAGFTNAAYVDPQAFEFLPDVRVACEDNRCGRYNTSWACPPACGTLAELEAKTKSFPYGIMLQMTGDMEDSFDFESIQRIERDCKAALNKLAEQVHPLCTRMMPLTAGGCDRCKTCTYPDAPCRFPDLMMPSLEACGLYVNGECQRVGLKYYYGPQTMTFCCAIMIED